MEIQNLTTTKKIPLESTQPFHIYLQQLQTCSKQDLIKKLKEKKKDIHEQTEQIIQNSKNYFIDLTTMIMQRETQIKRNIQNDMLECLQEIQSKIQELEEESTCSQLNYSQIYQIAKIISTNFCQVEGSHEEIKKYLNSIYQVSIVSINTNASNLDNTNKIILSQESVMQTNKKTIYGRCSQLSQISQADFQILIQKYQQKQQKNMLANERLKKKIQSLQQLLSKKGVKDLNKLSQKKVNQKNDYFDLQIHRIRSQNKILTEQITTISNKLLTLTSQNQGLKAEIKKYLLPHSQGTLSNRTSLIQEHLEDHSNFYNKQNEAFQNICGSQIQSQILIEFQNKNQQLSLQLSKKIKQIQQIREQSNKKQQEVIQFRSLLTQKTEQLEKLSNNYQNLSHDYQISCKKKFELQDRIAGMKNFTKQFQRREEDMKSNYQNQVLSLKSMLNLKELSISQYEAASKQNAQKLSQALNLYETNLQQLKSSFQSQRKDFLKQIQSIKQSQQKQKIKLQFTKKQISRLNEQVSLKYKQVQDLTKQLKELKFLQQEQLTSKDKNDIQKKQLSKLKKQIKQIKKEHQNQLKKNNDMFNQKYNMFLERVNTLVSQFQKIKQSYEGKIKIYQNRLIIMKQKTTYHLHQLATSTTSNNKSSKSLTQTLEKYIQAMNSSATKNAEIKKLKQELKQFKENKKVSSNIMNTNNININSHLEKDLLMANSQKNIQDHCNSYLYSFQKKVYDERINLQKSSLQEKIKQKDQKIQILQTNIKSLDDKIKHEKNAFQEQKTKRIKQEKQKQSQQKNAQINKIKSLEQKLSKMDTQMKSTKNILKKCQSQSAQLQTQLKKKKQHIINLKKQIQCKEELTKEFQKKTQLQNQQIEKQKRLLKDYSTKELLLFQMKQRTQEYKSLQIQNDNLKKLLQRQEKQLKYQISKKQTEIKTLKTSENIQIKKIINQKNTALEDQLSDLKQKNKKLKNQLQRKQTFCNHLKQKYEKNIEQLQKANIQKDMFIQKIQNQINSLQKKYEATYSSLKKVEGRCKLQIVSIKKIFQKIAQHVELQMHSYNKNSKPAVSQNHKTKDCTFKSQASLLTPGYSQIPKDMSSIQMFNEEHYADTLKMFNISMNQFKQIAMKNESQFINTTNLQSSPILNFQTAKYQSPVCSKQQPKNSTSSNVNMKTSLQKLQKVLQKPQINVTQIVNIFEELIQKQKQ